MQKRSYKSFRERIEVDYEKLSGSTDKRVLQLKMKELGYRGKKVPTIRQVNFVWDELKKEGLPISTIEFFIIEIYGKRKVYRANQTIVINRKTYRKGQFIPKQK